MQPNSEPKPAVVTSWDDFKAKRAAKETAADLGGQLAESVKQAPAAKAAPRLRRKPNAIVEASLAETLRRAVQIAIARRGRASREEAVREQVLLEVLSEAMRRIEA